MCVKFQLSVSESSRDIKGSAFSRFGTPTNEGVAHLTPPDWKNYKECFHSCRLRRLRYSSISTTRRYLWL